MRQARSVRGSVSSTPDRWGACPSLAGVRTLAGTLLALALLGASTIEPAEPNRAEDAVPRSPEDAPVQQDLDLGDDLFARALATALQSVYDRYIGAAAPIPAEVQEQLGNDYGPELSRARFVVSEAAVRLLATIDRFEGTDFGEGMHALTINDLILLAANPAENESPFAMWIWAHELHHVRQYRERGSLLAFARNYLRHCEAVERAADERANRALGMDVSVHHCLK